MLRVSADPTARPPTGDPTGAEPARLGPLSRFRRNELNSVCVMYRVVAANPRSIRAYTAASARTPPFQALREDRAFPSSVRGPVDFFQGLRARIRSACFRRSRGVQRGMVIAWLRVMKRLLAFPSQVSSKPRK